MASIFDEKGGQEKLRSGSLASMGPKVVVRPMYTRNPNSIYPGRPIFVGANGDISNSGGDNNKQIAAAGRYDNRKRVGGKGYYPCVFRGIIFTHGANMENPGDIVGNLLCLGTAPDVDSGRDGEPTVFSRVALVLKKPKRAT